MRLRDYFQLAERDGRWVLSVARMTWPEVHRPETIWRAFRSWKAEPGRDRVERAKAAAMRLRRFFRACTTCGRLTATDEINPGDVCDRCYRGPVMVY